MLGERECADLVPIKIQLEWMPLYVQRLKASAKYRAMLDFQQAWYLNLLFECWDSDNPGYLRDNNELWKLANARSERFFAEKKAAVMACFESTVLYGEPWIFNRRLLAVHAEQRKKLTKGRSYPQQVPLISVTEFSELRKAVERTFVYYCEKAGRRVGKYTLTDDRRKAAEDRFVYRMDAGHISLVEAEQEARIAIDNLVENQWNRDNKRIDWMEQLFRSNAEFEKRLNAIARKPDGEDQRRPVSAVEQRQEQNRSAIQRAVLRRVGGTGGVATGRDAKAPSGHDVDG